MKTLKEEIKQLSAQQVSLKQQRKTVKFEGQRTLSPSQAASQHSLNREKLRYLYLAYGLLRGKTLEQVEANSKKTINETYLEKLLEQYKYRSDTKVA